MDVSLAAILSVGGPVAASLMINSVPPLLAVALGIRASGAIGYGYPLDLFGSAGSSGMAQPVLVMRGGKIVAEFAGEPTAAVILRTAAGV